MGTDRSDAGRAARNAGETFRPLHILILGPLALYCAVVGVIKWRAG